MDTLSTLSPRALKKLFIAFALYLTSLMAANTLGLKAMPFLFDSHVSVAVFSFPLVFIMTDIVGELYGKPVARLFVLGGVVSTVLFIVYSLLSVALPWSDASSWAQEGYNTIFTVSIRMAIASIAAFAIAEYQDVFAFFFLKKRITGSSEGRLFWLRSNLSNIWSQLLDTVIFMVIAFVGVYSWPALLSLMLTWWLYKVGMGFLYTPLSYIGLRLLADNTKQS